MAYFVVAEMSGPDAEGWVAIVKDPPVKRAGIGALPLEALDNLLKYLETEKGS